MDFHAISAVFYCIRFIETIHPFRSFIYRFLAQERSLLCRSSLGTKNRKRGHLFDFSSSCMPPFISGSFFSSHNHHFKWWFGLALIRAGYMLAQKGGYRKRCYWSAYKAVLLESSFLDSSACSLIYFFIASSVILPIVET